MEEDHFLDVLESEGEMWITAWRCLNCGNVLDHIVEQNRMKYAAHPVASYTDVPVKEADAGFIGQAVSFPHAA
jgi:hypothetical protein